MGPGGRTWLFLGPHCGIPFTVKFFLEFCVNGSLGVRIINLSLESTSKANAKQNVSRNQISYNFTYLEGNKQQQVEEEEEIVSELQTVTEPERTRHHFTSYSPCSTPDPSLRIENQAR